MLYVERISDVSCVYVLTEHRIHPTNGYSKILSRVDMKHREWTRGWAWMDVDRYETERLKAASGLSVGTVDSQLSIFTRCRWGTTGPKDGIYWVKFVGEVFHASHGPNRGSFPRPSALRHSH